MKKRDSKFIVNCFLYGLSALLSGVAIYEIGYIKGLSHAYKTGLQKKIEILEEEMFESMKRQIFNEKKTMTGQEIQQPAREIATENY